MKFSIKTTLTAFTLMVTAFSIYGAQLTPQELEHIERDYTEEAIQKSQHSQAERKQKSAPAKSILSEDEELARALSLSLREAEEHKRKHEATHPIKGFKIIQHKVHPQRDTACGLHAIDNGNKCYNALLSGKSSAELATILMTDLSAAAQTVPVKKRNMLQGEGISRIAKHILHMDESSFTILDSPEMCLVPDYKAYLPYTFIPALHALRTKARATHIFIIADEIHNESRVAAGEKYHWLAIVADKKDGIVTLHYMCSGGSDHTRVIELLKQIIQDSPF
jgi:hypothetical protein